jgi:peroxiredoxin
MFHKLIGLFVVVVLSFNSTAQDNFFQIDVKLKGAEDGNKIQLYSFQGGKEIVIDSAVVKGGQFKLETKTKELRFYYIIYKEGEVPVVLFLDEACKNVKIKGDIEKLAENYEVTGSKYSKEFKEYQDFSYQFLDEKTAVYTEFKQIGTSDSSKVNALIEKLDSLNTITKRYAIDYIEKNPASPVSWMMLNEFYPSTGLDGYDMSQLDNFDVVAKAMREKYPYSEYPALIEQDVLALRNQIEQMKYKEVIEKSGANSKEIAPDIQLEDPNGNIIALSSLRGQVVLLDFWASWCKPCRQENPNVVAAYEKYKNEGFTIYSVSLDENRAAWVKAIEVDNLSWVNHVSDLKGWHSSAATLYGVQSIPSSFLIDRNGLIIAQNLRGAALEQKLQDVFGK